MSGEMNLKEDAMRVKLRFVGIILLFEVQKPLWDGRGKRIGLTQSGIVRATGNTNEWAFGNN